MKKTLLGLLLITVYIASAQNYCAAQYSLRTGASRTTKIESLKHLDQKYDIKQYLENYELVIVFHDDHYGVVTLDDRVVIPIEYTCISYEESARLLLLNKEGHIGFANPAGRILIPLDYMGECNCKAKSYFTQGMLCVQRDGFYGVTDLTGREVVPYIYSTPISIASAAKRLLYAYSKKGDMVCLLRFNGDTVIGPSSSIKVSDDGLVCVQRDGLIGYYTTEGIELIPCKYKDVSTFVNGKAIAQRGSRRGIIDRRGKEVVPFAQNRIKGDVAFLLKSGLVATFQGDHCGVVDMDGNVVIPIKYHAYYGDATDRIALLDENHTLFLFDTAGNLLDQFDTVSHAEMGYSTDGTPVCKDDLWGYANSDWRIVITPQYRELIPIGKNHFNVLFDDGNRGVIDLNGHTLFKGPYSSISKVCNGIFHVNSYSDPNSETDTTISGFVDIRGNTTFTDEELQMMSQWIKNILAVNR